MLGSFGLRFCSIQAGGYHLAYSHMDPSYVYAALIKLYSAGLKLSEDNEILAFTIVRSVVIVSRASYSSRTFKQAPTASSITLLSPSWNDANFVVGRKMFGSPKNSKSFECRVDGKSDFPTAKSGPGAPGWEFDCFKGYR